MHILQLLLVSGCAKRMPPPTLDSPAPTTSEVTAVPSEAVAPQMAAALEAMASAEAVPLPSLSSDEMRMHVIDVGQGAATLLEFPCGAVLIDAGGEDNKAFHSNPLLRNYLEGFFDSRPDLQETLASVIVTHPHIDHALGLVEIERYTVSNVVASAQTTGSGAKEQADFLAWAKAKAIPTVRVRSVDVPSGMGLTGPEIDPVESCPASSTNPVIRVLWGDDGKSGTANNDSVVVRVDFGESSAMITGDLQDTGPFLTRHKNTPILDVDIYELGHHGARNGTDTNLAKALSPSLALIAAGPFERSMAEAVSEHIAREYGHPNTLAIDALIPYVTDTRTPIDVQIGVKGSAIGHPRTSVFRSRRIDRAIYATGWDGDIVVTMWADGKLEVVTAGRE